MAAIRREGVYKDLMEYGWFKRLVQWRGLQFTLQFASLAAFGVIVYAGLFGTPTGAENLGSTFTWLVWWTLIPVTMLVGGKIWCLACPWIAPGEWLQRLTLWKKRRINLSLNWKVPSFLRNFWLMFFLFLLLHWADANFHLAARPETTVYLALGLFTLAIGVSLVFEKRSFCKFFCPVGAIISPYSMAAPVELRNKDAEVCHRCKTRDCIKGNEKGYACPMMIHPYAVDRNTYCLMCTECAKTCPNDNISVNIRKPFVDIFKEGLGFLRSKDVSLSLSFLAIALLGVIPFHNLEMTATYTALEASVADSLNLSSIVVRTVAFLTIAATAVAVFSGFSLLARWRAGHSEYSFQRMATWFALPFIPLAISLHVAHNYFHILEEGAIIIPNLSDPFGFGWNLFGTVGTTVTLLPANVISLLQFVTIGLGALATGYLLYRLALNMFAHSRTALRAMLPMSVFLVGLAGFYAWVLTIPMSMRF